MQTSPKTALLIGGGIAGPATALALHTVGIEAVIYEAQDASTPLNGAFLNLAPNGVNILKTLGVASQVMAYGFPCPGITFHNASGKQVGELNNDPEEERYGARSVLIKRNLLHQALREEATRRGIRIELGKRLRTIDEQSGKVVAHFEDGTEAVGDFLIGCDGIHSRTRALILPNAPQPEYTGLINFGGFATGLDLPPTTLMQMVFGRRGFFGYSVTPTGEVYWFSNLPQPQEPERAALRAISDDEWRQRLLDLHRDDPAPILDILHAASGGFGKWPIYDLPSLPTWHDGPICLIGDAAHATSPHVGQGASLALEDALVLAQCLRDASSLHGAFATFERLRKGRTEKLVAQARRTGASKVVSNPVQGWFRDLTLPFFLKLGAKSTEWVYAYKVDLNRQAA